MKTRTPAPTHGQPILSARTILAAALAAACAGSAFSPAAQAAPPAKAGQWAAGRILVQAKAGYSGADLEAALNTQGARSKGRIAGLGVQVVEVPAGAEDAMVRQLSRHPGVKFAEKDMRIPPQFAPNDTYFGSEWHLGKIQAPAAWDSYQGAGVTVAILDSGVDAAHPDLAAQMAPGWNVVSNSGDTADINGHGTAVAGTAAAATNNAAGVASVAWGAKLMPVRITNDSTGYAYWSDIANGLTWAADHGAKVANVSYAVTGSATVESAAQYMQGKGGVVVVSAGNDGANSSYANSPYLITVSATDSADAKAGWSSYGNFLDVAAPGVGILTTTNGGGYGSWSGTSFSSPITAGVAALIMNANPALSPSQVDQVLKDSADKPSGANFDINYGYGRVNAASAVQLALNTPALDAQAPSAAIASPGGGATVQGAVPVSVSASDNVGVAQVVLYAGSQQVAADSVAPYQFSWDSTLAADGGVALKAVAYDAAGNQGASAAVTVTVDNVPNVADTTPPTVGFVTPSGGTKVSGTVAVQSTATDNVAVAGISFYVDNSLKATASSAALNYNWNTKNLKAGQHTLKVVAKDAAGNSGSASILVTK